MRNCPPLLNNRTKVGSREPLTGWSAAKLLHRCSCNIATRVYCTDVVWCSVAMYIVALLLQCILIPSALKCSSFQHILVHCTAVHFSALYCNYQQCTAKSSQYCSYSNALQCFLFYDTILQSIMQCIQIAPGVHRYRVQQRLKESKYI